MKNNLQVISSLLHMQGESVKDRAAAAALKESQQRVLSMAMIHERLYGNHKMDEIDFQEYTTSLVSELFSSYVGRTGNVTSRIESERISVDIDQAIPCGLILNELLTNALKYAYPRGVKGEVLICLKESFEGKISLGVSDHGVGMPPGFDWRNSQSLGLPIVDILAQQLNGELTVGAGPGASFTVEFPKSTNLSKTSIPGA